MSASATFASKRARAPFAPGVPVMADALPALVSRVVETNR